MSKITRNFSKLRVGVACNIKTDHSSEEQAEFDEPQTVAAICAALEEGGFETAVLEAADEFPQKLEAAAPDIVFNIAEGKSGRCREAQIPAILEYYGVPFTGSDAAALSIAMDKALTKQIAQSLGIETPPYYVIRKGDAEFPDKLSFPLLVKPNAEGSSMWISDTSIAGDTAELRGLVNRLTDGYDGDLLAEAYIDGREFTVGIIGNGSRLRVFDPMEIIFYKQKGPYKIYSYEIKQNFKNYIRYECPPNLPEETIARMKNSAEGIYETLGCLDFARIDFRLSENGTVYFIEVNPLPGLNPGYSDFPMLAGYHGIPYNSLIRAILHCALKRYGIKAGINNE